jgi:hypothetical protein
VEQHLCLFNTEAYHRLHLQPPQEYLRIDYHDEGRLVGSCAGMLNKGVFDCGHRAPFGGIDICGDYQSPRKLSNLITWIMSEARARGAQKIRIRCRPHYMSPSEPMMQFALIALGFRIEQSELSQGIELSAFRTADEYRANLKKRTRYALKQCMEMGISSMAAHSDADWGEGYDVLQRNRALREHSPLKYSLEYLQQLRVLFPGKLQMRLLRYEERSIAAALVYTVLPSAHYLASWGDAGHEMVHSPMTLLAHQLVVSALDEGVRVVDLGISSANGVADEGLVLFKRHVGASSSLRLEVVRDL